MRYTIRSSMLGSVVVLLTLTGDASLLAQESVEIKQALSCFEALSLSQSRRCPAGTLGASAILERPEDFNPGQVGQLLEGLKVLAIHHDSSIVRVSATNRLMAVGTSSFRSRGSLPSTHHLVEQVLSETSDPGVLLAIIRWAPRQDDGAWGLDLLADVASRDDGFRQHPPFSFQAIQEMLRFGAAGESKIQELVSEGRIKNPMAVQAANKILSP